MAENWDGKLVYLQKNKFLNHNDDYLEFLVKKVWCLNKPCKVADFGCGYGYIGTKILPLLPEGTSYTGIDKSPTLLKAARDIYHKLPYPYKFIKSEVYDVPIEDNSFDVTISHTVLMHLERPVEALKEMIRVTRDGGMVITCDTNHNAWNALFYVDEINTQDIVPLRLFQQINKDIREKTGVDYNIGIKTPVLIEKAGLKNVGCRTSDRVVLLFPEMEAEKKKLIHEALCREGLSLPKNFNKTKEQWRKRLLSHGVSAEDIEKQMAIEVKMDFRHKGDNYHTAFPQLLTWSYGTVEKLAGRERKRGLKNRAKP